MPDIYSKQKRSEIMSHISSKETKPEIMVRKFLFANGLRFRKNVKTFPENLILSYRNIKLSFSFTAVFGTDILAKEEHYLQQMPNFGKTKSAEILNEINVMFRSWRSKVGKLLLFGSVK